MKIVFTDLDGTLLDRATYDFGPALDALQALRTHAVPLVLCSSKTRAELEFWQTRLQNCHPFIVENGGAIFIPRDYFQFQVPEASQRERYEVIELGVAYPELVRCLRLAALKSACGVVGFHDMSAVEVSRLCGLPLDLARLAKQREYDEPFLVTNGHGSTELLRLIEDQGKHWTHGGRFFHISGSPGKAKAVDLLIELYRRMGHPVWSMGLGDAPNDSEFLKKVDLPVIVRSPLAMDMKAAVPGAGVTESSGPHGWSQAVLSFLKA